MAIPTVLCLMLVKYLDWFLGKIKGGVERQLGKCDQVTKKDEPHKHGCKIYCTDGSYKRDEYMGVQGKIHSLHVDLPCIYSTFKDNKFLRVDVKANGVINKKPHHGVDTLARKYDLGILVHVLEFVLGMAATMTPSLVV